MQTLKFYTDPKFIHFSGSLAPGSHATTMARTKASSSNLNKSCEGVIEEYERAHGDCANEDDAL